MNSTAKTVVMWVLILVLAIGLWNFVEKKSEIARILNLTDFVDKVEHDRVAEVTIAGSTITGRLRPNNEPFKSTMPPGYTAPYDQLLKARVKVTVMPEDKPAWFIPLMSSFMPLLVAFGLGWLCASRFQRPRPQPPMTAA